MLRQDTLSKPRTPHPARSPIPSLTGLRFAAAFCVVLAHAIPKIVALPKVQMPVLLLSTLSAEGMSLFFVLSGFVIYYNYSHTIRSRAGLYNFFVARFARLYPLYFAAMCYDMIISVSYAKIPALWIGLPYYATLTQSWIYMAIGNNALIYQFGIISQLAWSISTEWFFYLLFPLACLAIVSLATVRKRLWATAILIVAALATLATLTAEAPALLTYGIETYGPVGADPQDSFYRWLMYFSPYARLFEFLLGCLCASIFVTLSAPSKTEERMGLWLTYFALLVIAVLHWLMFGFESGAMWHRVVQGLHMNFGFAPFIALLIFCCARYRNGFSGFMAAPTLILCGEASYSLYLLHIVVINAFRYETGTIVTWHAALIACARMGMVIAACVGLSLVSWYTIEVPARRWLRRMFSVSAPRATTETTITASSRALREANM
jgi:peptidoglycan/LPS O-acetylase OafA/YrhL